MIILLIVMVWVGCGILSAGYHYAFFQRKFPEQARGNERSDFWGGLLVGIAAGPAGVAVVIFDPYWRSYGWTLRRPDKNLEALCDLVLGSDDD